MFIIMNTSKLRCLFQLIRNYSKKLGILCLAVLLCIGNILPVAASDELVTVDVPLSWYDNKYINIQTGAETSSSTASATAYMSVIEGASYTVSYSPDDSGEEEYNACVIYWYDSNYTYLGYEYLWTMEMNSVSVEPTVPAGAAYFRLTSDLNSDDDNIENNIRLAIRVSASYVEKHDVVEETLQDVVYRDDNQSISNAASEFTEEYSKLEEQENYLIEESKYIFDDFFTSFNWSALEEYLAGFQFVGTWFGNFYNSHSAMGVCVGMGSALVLIFVLVRFRGH